MSPTIFRWKGYRFYFFSREETRMHVHVVCSDGEAKFWLEPKIEIAANHQLTKEQLGHIEKVVQERIDEIAKAWQRHFAGGNH